MIDAIKNAAAKVKSFVNTLIKMFKFVVTPLGQIIGVLVLVVVLVALVYVAAKALKHTLGIFGNNEYAGISTDEDYETIIGSLGYTGYDAFISEELWQEYLAFEYAVLMDLAEYIYENQDYVTKLPDPNGGEYTTSAVFPEGFVSGDYDGGAITKEQWQQYVVKGQAGSAPNKLPTDPIYYVGGNRKVTTPRLIYEVADHEYEDEALSLMPYLVVVREDIELNYFIKGLPGNTWDSYNNLDPISSADLNRAKNDLDPVRFSAELNRYNVNMPTSGYKEDLENDQKGEFVVGVEDKEGFIDADREEGYGDSVYYTEQETDIVYKIPLRVLVNRYLPKSILLTSWYMLKPDDVNANGFKVEEMMEDIKGIYNAACLNSGLEVPEIKVTGKINESGEIEPYSLAKTLRNNSEDVGADGVATSNWRTFMYFEQFGLETSRYEQYVAYKGPSGDNEPYDRDEAKPEEISPSATYLTRDRDTFIKTINLTLGQITFKDGSWVESLDVRLKPTYILEPGATGQIINTYVRYYPQPDGTVKAVTYNAIANASANPEQIEEKLKNNYAFPSDIVNIEQEEPYSIMKLTRDDAESALGNHDVSLYSGEEAIYDYDFINKYYMIADIGNTDELEEDIEKYGLVGYSTEDAKYKLAEDYRYYNQDDKMPHWYAIRSESEKQNIEAKYLRAFQNLYLSDFEKSVQMLAGEMDVSASEIASYVPTAIFSSSTSANLYQSYGGEHDIGDAALDNVDGSYKMNYYWDALYVIEEKELQMRQTIYHRRMPAVLVKYADTWAKSIEYENKITQNSLDYRDYRYLIPNSKTSLGMMSMKLKENPKYRVDTYKDYFNKIEDTEATGLKEADALEMLIQWESLGDNGNDTAYAYMRDLYKLILFIRDDGKTMLENAYTYLYIPSTISNYDDATIQKIFWLERLGVSQGEDELNEDEQNTLRTKANEIYWQNLEYDEYYECITDLGDKEEAKVYAVFPFGAPVIKAYYMLNNIDNLTQNGFKGAAHPATDIYSRAFAKEILRRGEEGSAAEFIYYYELNRLTIYYMNNRNMKEDAFLLAEKELNETLELYTLYSPVVAIAPGYVQTVDYDARSGFYVSIVHDYKSGDNSTPQITSLYAHLKRWPLVEVGDYVGAGTVLGYEGTTGRSTGNHLHLEIKIDGVAVDPHDVITPVFAPFYYAEKAKETLEKDEERALGTEYYKLERTILLEDRLFNKYNVINGMKLQDGTIVNYTASTNSTTPYNSGDPYDGWDYGGSSPASPSPSASPSSSSSGGYGNLIWGNNVPEKYMAADVSEIMDLNLLNQTVEYKPEEGDAGGGQNLTFDIMVKANPDCFNVESDFVEKRLEWPKWFAVAMAEYKSSLAVPYYNGPVSATDEITEEGLEDLKAIQNSLKRAGYFRKAGVKWATFAFGTYSDEFVTVVETMQDDLEKKGYPIGAKGKLDAKTMSSYNTMVQYTNMDNQFAMGEKTSYNSSVDLSIEPALIWAIAKYEGGGAEKYIALKESDNKVSAKELDYTYYSTEDSKYYSYIKQFNREQGIMQISPEIAIKRYKEDKIKAEDAVLFIRQPMRNTNIGMEMVKEYMLDLYEENAEKINAEKNKVVFDGGGCEYWRKVYEECQEYDKRWIDPENIDRLMLYALALDAYDKEGVENVDVDGILANGPSGYAFSVLENFKNYIIDEK